MTVLQFSAALAPSPTLLTVYCVQSYWRDRDVLKEGRLQQFANMESALRAGQLAARRAPLVKVSRVRGNPQVDYWEEPVTVARFGDCAAEDAAAPLP
jgi:hypothetical protein